MNGVNFSLKAYHREWSLAHAFLNQNLLHFWRKTIMNGVNLSLKAYHREWSLAHTFLNQNFIVLLYIRVRKIPLFSLSS